MVRSSTPAAPATLATTRQHCHLLCAQNPSSRPAATALTPATGATHSGVSSGGDGGGGRSGGGDGGGRGGGGGARASTSSRVGRPEGKPAKPSPATVDTERSALTGCAVSDSKECVTTPVRRPLVLYRACAAKSTACWYGTNKKSANTCALIVSARVTRRRGTVRVLETFVKLRRLFFVMKQSRGRE